MWKSWKAYQWHHSWIEIRFGIFLSNSRLVDLFIWLTSFIYLFSCLFDCLFAFSAPSLSSVCLMSLCILLLLKKVEKTCIFTQKWLDHLVLMTSCLVTIVTDHVYFVRLRWPSHQLRLVLFDLFWSHYLKHLNNSFQFWRYLILVYISSFPQQSSYLQNLSVFKKNHHYIPAFIQITCKSQWSFSMNTPIRWYYSSKPSGAPKYFYARLSFKTLLLPAFDMNTDC